MYHDRSDYRHYHFGLRWVRRSRVSSERFPISPDDKLVKYLSFKISSLTNSMVGSDAPFNEVDPSVRPKNLIIGVVRQVFPVLTTCP